MHTQFNTGTIALIARSFCATMVWADSEEGTMPRVPEATRLAAQEYVQAFLNEYPVMSRIALDSEDYGWDQGVHDPCGQFGHDLYLTARGHGAGFADRTDTLGTIAASLHEAIRQGWRRWEIEVDQANGWMYLMDRATREVSA